MSLTIERSSEKAISPASFPALSQEADRFHWTVPVFYRAVDAGVFEKPQALELIHGEIRNRETVNPPHATVARRTARLLRRLLAGRFLVMDDKPVLLAEDTLVQPDISLVAGQEEDYDFQHPTPEAVRLIVEVADATEDKDTGEKARLYAQAGIADYWVILVNRRQVNVYRTPIHGEYGSRGELNENDMLAPLAAPEIVITVAEMFPPRAEVADGESHT